MKTYEIHNLTTKELLVDNLTFDDIPELFEAYQNFYPNNEIAVFRRIDGYIKLSKYYLKANLHKQQDFKVEWFDLIEEYLCNIY